MANVEVEVMPTKPKRTFHKNTCVLCNYTEVCCDTPQDKIWVCGECRVKRKKQLYFTCPLCKGRVFSSPDWTMFWGTMICGQCGSNLSRLKRLSEEGSPRATHLYDKAKLIIRPIHGKDRRIPWCIDYAESMWGNVWTGPPSTGDIFQLGRPTRTRSRD